MGYILNKNNLVKIGKFVRKNRLEKETVVIGNDMFDNADVLCGWYINTNQGILRYLIFQDYDLKISFKIEMATEDDIIDFTEEEALKIRNEDALKEKGYSTAKIYEVLEESA